MILIYNSMFKNFYQYNESLRDQMKPKKLDRPKLEFFNLYNLCNEIGFEVTKITTRQGTYWFNITNIADNEFKIAYNDYNKWKDIYKQKVLDTQTFGWEIVHHSYDEGILDENKIYKFDDIDSLIKKLIELAYNDIDETIKSIEKHIREYKWKIKTNTDFKKKLEKAKEIYYGIK